MTKKSIGSGRGSVYNILLKALQTGDKYAYEICKEVEEKTNGDYILNQQSSYSGLKRLEQRQEITSYWKDSDLGGRRHYYSLTEKGRQRLENSNFSWEDARDQIVDNLFEKSTIDKAIDEVNDDIAEIKSATNSSQEEQTKIDEVINYTNKLSAQNDDNAQSNQLDDLFSMFSQTTKENQNEMQLVDDKSTKNVANGENDKSKNAEAEIQAKSVENSNNDQSTHAEYSSFAQTTNEPENNKKTDEVDDLFSFASSSENLAMQESSNRESTVLSNFAQSATADQTQTNLFESVYSTQNSDTAQVEQPAQKNQQTTQDNQFDDLIKNMQTILENEQNKILNPQSAGKTNTKELEKNQDNFETYRLSHKSANFIDHSYSEKPSNNYFDDVFGLSNMQTDNSNKNIFEQNDKNNAFDETLQGKNVPSIDTNENETIEKVVETENQSSIDFSNIFGDLVSSDSEAQNDLPNNPQTDFEQKQENVANDSQQIESLTTEVQTPVEQPDDKLSIEQSKQQAKEETAEELPYRPINDNINQTLAKNGYTSQNSTDLIYNTSTNYGNNSYGSDYVGFNDPYANSEFDRWGDKKPTAQDQDFGNFNAEQETQNQFVEQTTQIDQSDFDKQYQGIDNEIFIPTQTIRYYQKPAEKPATSRFVLTNKLNLFAVIILGFVLAVFNTITLLLCQSVFGAPKAQILACEVFYALIALVVLTFLVKYLCNKSKRSIDIGKIDTIVCISLALVVGIMAFVVNINMGMTLKNIGNYFATFSMPILFAIELLFVHMVKKMLSKSSKFYR